MKSGIVSSLEPVGLVGGGPLPLADLESVLSTTSVLVAADGGAAPIVSNGHQPDAVIGDFDSIPPKVVNNLPPDILHRIEEQNSTDFDKALRNIDAPVTVAAGVMGGRLDHQLAALHVLTAHPDRACIVLHDTEVVFLVPRHLDIATRVGDVVSLMPMAEVTGRSSGLEWEIDGLIFDPLRQIGTSNRAKGPLRIEMDGPAMLGVFPRRLLPDLIAFMSALSPSERWPAL